METRHLFFTLRLIWNHTRPIEEIMDIVEGNLYTLGPFYTKDYLAQAARAIGKELAGRHDIQPQWMGQLITMRRIWEIRNEDQRHPKPRGNEANLPAQLEVSCAPFDL